MRLNAAATGAARSEFIATRSIVIKEMIEPLSSTGQESPTSPAHKFLYAITSF
jgi:hypothetical protein